MRPDPDLDGPACAHGFGLILGLDGARSEAMATCVFLASGPDFAVDECFQMSPFRPHVVFHQGTPPAGASGQPPRLESGFTVVVHEDLEPSLRFQVGQALDFLARHEHELIRLRTLGATTLALNFGVTRSDTQEHCDSIPPALVQAMARFHMGLNITSVSRAGNVGA